MFELLHALRRSCVEWLNAAAKERRKEFVGVLERVYESAMGDKPPAANTAAWTLVSGDDVRFDCVALFVLCRLIIRRSLSVATPSHATSDTCKRCARSPTPKRRLLATTAVS